LIAGERPPRHPDRVRVLVLMASVVACRGGTALHPAGSDNDDGHGILGNASAKLLTSDDDGDDPFAPRPHKEADDEFGGSDYSTYTVPSWTAPTPAHRTSPRHVQTAGLTGAIEGRVTWRGAIPEQRATPCGPIDVARVGTDRGVADVVIYIEQVKVGRPLPTDGRSATVGGAVVKRGCALLPTAQIVTPLPASVTVDGDAVAAKLRIVEPPPRAPRSVELQEGGRVEFSAELGVTRIEAVDGKLAAAWVLGIDAPYYAITDDHGHFRIDELAPGTYDVTVWRAPLPGDGSGPLVYDAPVIVHRKVTIPKPAANTKTVDRPVRLDVAIGR